jgi:hypothetical protein
MHADLGEDMVKHTMTELAALDRRPVPYIVTALIRYIDEHGLTVEVRG